MQEKLLCLREGMAKHLLITVLCTVILTATVSSVWNNRVSIVSESVERYSSAQFWNSKGEYVITAKENGLICAGRAYSSRTEAYKNPVILTSDERVRVTITDDEDENNILFYPGDNGLLALSDLFYRRNNNAYIFVIVKPLSDGQVE